jgi:chromate transporter
MSALRPGMRDLLLYFLRLGTTGFGGPVALVGYMQRDLVDERGWFTPAEYREGLALAQLAPGPLAAQLAMYLGWSKGGAAGAGLVGLAFVLPSFLMVIAIAVGYLRFGGLPWMQGAFYGIGAAVIAVIARSVVKLTRLTLAADRLRWVLFASPPPSPSGPSRRSSGLVGAGVVALFLRAQPYARTPEGRSRWDRLGPAHRPGRPAGERGDAWRIAWYFTEAGTSSSAARAAVVPFPCRCRQRFAWLDERQFLDAVAVAMITPGPVVITVGFIGYLVAGFAGAVVAAVATFLPCYLFTVIPAPHFRRLSQSRGLQAFVEGVTAAATGAIAGAAVVLGRRALVDGTTVGIALGTLLVLTRFKRVPEPLLIAGAGILGIILKQAG